MKMKLSVRNVVGALIAGGLVTFATNLLASDQPSKFQEDVGQEYFVRYCSSCHGLDGRGHGPVANALRTQPSDLTLIADRRGGQFPDAEIAAFIDGRTVVAAHGTREMPVWGERFSKELGGDSIAEEMTRGRLDVLIAYLKSIQSATVKPAPPSK
jgi:mono/diheme cytochrome c family protein